MKTLVCQKPKEFVWKEQSQPVPQEGESLVRMRQMGVCGTDLHAFNGVQPFFNYPRVLGHELAGTVETIVGETHGLSTGDSVVIMPYLECGECIACRKGKPNCCTNIQVVGVHHDGGMTEWLTLPTDHLIKAEGLTYDEMALVECLAIGAHAVRRAAVMTNEYVVVVGAGPIGLGTMQFAKAAGAQVIALDVNESRLEFCKQSLGIDYTVNALKTPLEDIQTITQGEFPTVVLDATGSPKAMKQSLGYLAHGGRLVYIGLFQGELSFNDPEFHKRETTMMASRNATREDFQHVISSLQSKAVKSSCYVSHRANFEEVHEIFPQWLEPESKVIKAMIHFN